MNTTPKHWYESKTLWLQVAAMAAVVLQYVFKHYAIDPELQVVVLAVLNMIVRLYTTQPLTK